MYKYFTAFFCFLSFSAWTDEPHKIIYLISPPRSLSTGFLRMIEARGDFKIFHEPAMSVYHHVNHCTFSRFIDGAFHSFDEVKKALFESDKDVFVKEMAFTLLEVLDEDLIKNPNVYFVFLLREPHSSIISFYLKLGSTIDNLHEAIGYRASYTLFQRMIDCGARQPLILFSEELASQPESVIKTFCTYVDIPFKKEALSWNNLGKNFDGHDAWNEFKQVDLTQYWHGDAIESTSFNPLKSYDTDDLGNPTFSEVKDIKDREGCCAAYQYSLSYYRFFQSVRH